MKVGVVGLGYWGPNIVRNMLDLNQDVTIFDRDEARIRTTRERFPACNVASSLGELLSDPAIAAIAIAVPLPCHCEIVIRVLQSRKHVFVEKPLCASSAEADAIQRNLNGSILMVAHITQFSRGIERLTELIRANAIGNVRRLSFVRTHFGPVYRETDVLTEVAAHDVAILSSLIPDLPASVNAWGVRRLTAQTPDAAHIVLQWHTGCVAQIDVQWSSVLRRREIEIEGTFGTLFFRSDTAPEELTWYDHKSAYELLGQGGQIAAAKDLICCHKIDISRTEPLRDELSYFLECIENHTVPKTDFAFSRRVVGVLEAARRSMQHDGERVDL